MAKIDLKRMPELNSEVAKEVASVFRSRSVFRSTYSFAAGGTFEVGKAGTVTVTRGESPREDVTVTVTGNGCTVSPTEFSDKTESELNQSLNVTPSETSFTITLSAEKDGRKYELGTYKGTATPKSTKEILEKALSEGGTYTLNADIEGIDETGLTSSKTMVLNLGGHKIKGAKGYGIKVTGGNLTINADEAGGIEIGSGADGAAVVADKNSTVTINGGTYKVGKDADNQGNSCIYSKGGTVTITGGTYETEAQWNGKYYVLNVLNDSNGTFKVSGGKFKGYDPKTGDDVGGQSFVEQGYESKEESGYYVVKPASEAV